MITAVEFDIKVNPHPERAILDVKSERARYQQEIYAEFNALVKRSIETSKADPQDRHSDAKFLSYKVELRRDLLIVKNRCSNDVVEKRDVCAQINTFIGPKPQSKDFLIKLGSSAPPFSGGRTGSKVTWSIL